MSLAATSRHAGAEPVPVEPATMAAALRFFWVWLLASSTVSIVGNATHAVLGAHPGMAIVSAAVAVVPPLVLLAATHGVAMLAKVGRTSVLIALATVLTVCLGVFAFVLSFDALEALALAAGTTPSRAWMWPAAVDGGITLPTIAIFGLSRLASTPLSTERDTAPAADQIAEPHDSVHVAPQRAVTAAQIPPRTPQPPVEAPVKAEQLPVLAPAISKPRRPAPRQSARGATDSSVRPPNREGSPTSPGGEELLRIGSHRTSQLVSAT